MRTGPVLFLQSRPSSPPAGKHVPGVPVPSLPGWFLWVADQKRTTVAIWIHASALPRCHVSIDPCGVFPGCVAVVLLAGPAGYQSRPGSVMLDTAFACRAPAPPPREMAPEEHQRLPAPAEDQPCEMLGSELGRAHGAPRPWRLLAHGAAAGAGGPRLRTARCALRDLCPGAAVLLACRGARARRSCGLRGGPGHLC